MMDTNVKRGDIYYADLSPVVGSEQGGPSPVLIVQNAIGNWLMLVGQAIVTFNAQLQYCMNGPGPCFGENVSTQTSAQTVSQERSSIEQRLDLLEEQMAVLRQQLSEQRLSGEWQLMEQLCRNLAVVQQTEGNNPF